MADHRTKAARHPTKAARRPHPEDKPDPNQRTKAAASAALATAGIDRQAFTIQQFCAGTAI